LLESQLRPSQRLLLGAAVVSLIIAVAATAIFMLNRSQGETPSQNTENTEQHAEVIATDIGLPTVTPAPPTRTPSLTPSYTPTPMPTPTREPCFQEVKPNDTVFGLATLCGHLSFDIVPLIVEINELSDGNSISLGQVLEIPWPTETPDPNQPPSPEPQANPTDENTEDDGTTDSSESGDTASAFDEDFDPLFVPTATLQPDVIVHTVELGETIISIGVQYGANVEILSQLNPEITFSQCDFGQDSGGQRCTVPLFEGQRVRVPAPTAVPTRSPTPSGSETPTPTLTATFNAPSLQRPTDRSVFLASELVTLRWNPTGTLSDNQVYLVTVSDLTARIAYSDITLETFYVLPEEWQGTDGQRHEYQWSVKIVNRENHNDVFFETETLTFFWEGLA